MIRAVLFLLCLSGCMSTTVVFNERWNPKSRPSYVDYFDTYWWGFHGKPEVSLQQVCLDQRPHALRRVRSAEDVAIGAVTLGVYIPLTVTVWCGD